MKKKRVFFLTLNYFQIILSVFLIGWLFGYKKKDLLDESYIGLIVFSVLLIFIANSLSNVFSVKTPIGQLSDNTILIISNLILTILFILSVCLMAIVSIMGIYTFVIGKRTLSRLDLAAVSIVLLSIINLAVLINQYYFKQQLKKEHKKNMESEIDVIGLEPSNHE